MTRPRILILAALLWLLACAGCTRSTFGPHEVHGPPLMVAGSGPPRLWVLSRREERRMVGVGRGRRFAAWRVDTFFHFQVQAFDPATARPAWDRTVLVLGDPKAGWSASRVVGAAAGGHLLGQQGDRVWLMLDGRPYALAADDGATLADAARIEHDNPALMGLLPVEAKFYGFDRGLVFTGGDGRRFVVRGPTLQAEPYVPAAPPETKPLLKANGSPVIVPLRRPFGREPARQVRLDGQWLGLYSAREAEDAAHDPFGDHLRWPYTVLDEGSSARRGFWRARISHTQRFEEAFDRLAALSPVAGAPFFLNGRFLEHPATGEPLVLDGPESVLVWHRTRIDRNGRLALARLGTDLQPSWSTPLPLSESGTANPVRFWVMPDRIAAMGNLETVSDGVSRRRPHLVSVALADGSRLAWDIADGKALP